MSFSTAGLIGAGVGLLCALVAYVMMSGSLRREQAAFDPARGEEERARLERIASIVRVILLADFVFLGAVGYYVGQLVWG